MHWVDLYHGDRDRLVMGLALLVVMLVVVEVLAVPTLLWLADASAREGKGFLMQWGLIATAAMLVGTILRPRGTPLILASALIMAVLARVMNIAFEDGFQVSHAVGGVMAAAQFLVLVVALFLGVAPATFFAASYGTMLALHLVIFGLPGLFAGALIAVLPVAMAIEEIRHPTPLEDHDTPLSGGAMLILLVAMGLMAATWAQLICLIGWTLATQD